MENKKTALETLNELNNIKYQLERLLSSKDKLTLHELLSVYSFMNTYEKTVQSLPDTFGQDTENIELFTLIETAACSLNAKDTVAFWKHLLSSGKMKEEIIKMKNMFPDISKEQKDIIIIYLKTCYQDSRFIKDNDINETFSDFLKEHLQDITDEKFRRSISHYLYAITLKEATYLTFPDSLNKYYKKIGEYITLLPKDISKMSILADGILPEILHQIHNSIVMDEKAKRHLATCFKTAKISNYFPEDLKLDFDEMANVLDSSEISPEQFKGIRENIVECFLRDEDIPENIAIVLLQHHLSSASVHKLDPISLSLCIRKIGETIISKLGIDKYTVAFVPSEILGCDGLQESSARCILLNQDAVYNFLDPYDLKNTPYSIFDTLFHEIKHVRQAEGNLKEYVSYADYLSLKEDSIITTDPSFYAENYAAIAIESEARFSGLKETLRFFNQISSEYASHISNQILISLKQELEQRRIHYPFGSTYDLDKKFAELIKKHPEIIKESPYYALEFTEEGEEKSASDILITLEESLKKEQQPIKMPNSYLSIAAILLFRKRFPQENKTLAESMSCLSSLLEVELDTQETKRARAALAESIVSYCLKGYIQQGSTEFSEEEMKSFKRLVVGITQTDPKDERLQKPIRTLIDAYILPVLNQTSVRQEKVSVAGGTYGR